MFRLPTGLIYTQDEGGWGQEDISSYPQIQ
jgi:hypothetical protein